MHDISYLKDGKVDYRNCTVIKDTGILVPKYVYTNGKSIYKIKYALS